MGQRGSAVEVLVHDAIEVKNVVAACRAIGRDATEETAGRCHAGSGLATSLVAR